MSTKYLRYRDVLVARGSDLYAALEAGNTKLAERIYKECEAKYRKDKPEEPSESTETDKSKRDNSG